MGTCKYTLVKPSNSNEFEVSIKNYNAWQHSVASMIESVFITIRSDNQETTVIELKAGKLQGNYPKKIYAYITNYDSNGVAVFNSGDSISSVTNADYTLVNSGSVATVTLANGVKVSFKASYWFCEVWVPDEFYNATAGLCGLYNENKAVDLIGSDGELYQKNDRLDVFINSWITDDRNCRKDPNPPPVCNNQDIINKCNEISNPDSYFGQCHDFVDPESFTQNCLTDLCELNNGQSICNIYDLYLTTCADAMNVTFCDWSRELGCEQSCGKNEEWSDCAGLCSDTPTCDQPNKEDLICPEKEQKSAMCICKDGYVMDGGKCVEIKDCGCDLGGVRVPNGYEYLNNDCSIRCHCTDGEYSCDPYNCDASTHFCQFDPTNPDYGTCERFSLGYCRASGDPHLQTFDGSKYDVMGTCQYYMVKTQYSSVYHSPVAVRVRNYRNKPDQKVSYVGTVWFDFLSRNGSIEYSIEMDRNLKSNRIDTTIIAKQNGLETVYTDGMSADNGDFALVNTGNKGIVSVKTWFSMEVVHKWSSNFCEINMPSFYQDKLSGLCGNYNGNKTDDYFGNDGIQYPYNKAGALEFQNTWVVPGQEVPGVDCALGTEVEPCIPSQNVIEKCSKLKEGYFSVCSNFDDFDVEGLYEECLMDYCENESDDEICGIYDAFATTCQTYLPKDSDLLCDWTTELGCVPECGDNEVWKGCGKTCNLDYCFKDSECTGNELGKPMCMCKPGFVYDQGRCIVPTECGCQLPSGIIVQNGYSELSADCSQTCTCENSVYSCKPHQCPGDSICSADKNGKPVCQNVAAGYCRARGDPHIQTFDNNKYDVMGTCLYHLVKVDDMARKGPKFEVNIKNYRAWSHNNKVSMVESVFIHVYSNQNPTNKTVIQLKAGPLKGNYPTKVDSYIAIYQNDLLMNQWKSSGVNNPEYKLTNNGGRAKVTTYYGLEVSFSAEKWNAEVWVPPAYFNRTLGLCGLYNQNKNEDFISADLEYFYPKPNDDFVSDWVVDPDEPCTVGGSPDVCTDTEVFEKCAQLADPNGYFSKCHEFVDPEPFVTDCQVDLCALNTHETECNIFDDYISECSKSLGPEAFCGWTSDLNCGKPCPAHSTWNDCADSCSDTPTCSEPNPRCDNERVDTVGMCVCDEGYVMEEGKCIRKQDCGCEVGQGIRVPNGYSYLTSTCQIECKCVASIWQCGEFDCNAVTHQCQFDPQNQDFGKCQERRTGYCRASGDPHIQTFDGSRYDVMGTCQYYMSVSEYESSIHSPYAVRIKNFRTSPSSPVSMVDRVYFDFKSQNYSTHYTIEIWRNGNSLASSISENGVNIPIKSSTVKNEDYTLVNTHGTAYVETWFGMKVQHRSAGYYAEIWAPSQLMTRTSGLCGDFDDIKQNDYRAPDGTPFEYTTDGAFQHGVSWIVEDAVPGCDPGPPITPPCEPSKDVKKKCEFILKDKYMKQCHEYVDPQPFYQDCLVDYCYVENEVTRCGIIESYVQVCKQHFPADEQENALCEWSEKAKCGEDCVDNASWKGCAKPCADITTCNDVFGDVNRLLGMKHKHDKPGTNDPQKCPEYEVTQSMCVCKKDYVLQDGKCIKDKDCGCYIGGGVIVPEGHEQLDKDCKKKYTCKDGKWTYQTAPSFCIKNSQMEQVCQIDPDNPDLGICVDKKQGFCRIAGQSHITTFDKLYYDINGDCTYYFAKFTSAYGPAFDVSITPVDGAVNEVLVDFFPKKNSKDRSSQVYMYLENGRIKSQYRQVHKDHFHDEDNSNEIDNKDVYLCKYFTYCLSYID